MKMRSLMLLPATYQTEQSDLAALEDDPELADVGVGLDPYAETADIVDFDDVELDDADNAEASLELRRTAPQPSS
jgi:hypothetical protein